MDNKEKRLKELIKISRDRRENLLNSMTVEEREEYILTSKAKNLVYKYTPYVVTVNGEECLDFSYEVTKSNNLRSDDTETIAFIKQNKEIILEQAKKYWEEAYKTLDEDDSGMTEEEKRAFAYNLYADGHPMKDYFKPKTE
ncbi:MAG: hypothetical protein HUJ88_11390 [Fusobacterium necrophorum]|nr:hypothetical protein [Fusobacterium necrophorum]